MAKQATVKKTNVNGGNGEGTATAELSGIAIEIPKRIVMQVPVEIVGDSILVVHNFSAKSEKQMLDKQMGKARGKKAPKDPEEDFNGARYILSDGTDGIRSVTIKSAMITACRQVDGISMALAKQLFFVKGDAENGEYCRIYDDKGKPSIPKMRQDIVRLAGPSRVADIRFRPEYWPWQLKFTVDFNPNMVTVEQVFHLIDLAGFGSGLCEGQPERSALGWGRFQLKKGGK